MYQQYLKIFIVKITSKMFADAEELLENMSKIKRRVRLLYHSEDLETK